MSKKDRTIDSCRVCSSHYIDHLCDTDNEHSQTTIIHHYRCQECGSVFVGNIINREELTVAYSTVDSKKYFKEIESENRKKMTTAMEHLNGFISKRDRIIDIGTGNGLFVEMQNDAGFEDVSAHEIEGEDLSEIAKIASRIYQDFNYCSIPSNEFHVVTLLDVVEHVIDPKYLINMCARILKKDGVIYFHTPVVTRTDRLMHVLQKVPALRKAGTIWQRGRTSIFHLENYTPKSLTTLLRNEGFSDIRIEVKNELSWPVSRYVKIYLLEKQGFPGYMAPIFAPIFYPFLATNLLNANKAIVTARKV